MKLASRIVAALALTAFAVPALACDGMKQASNEKKPAVAKAEKKTKAKVEKN